MLPVHIISSPQDKDSGCMRSWIGRVERTYVEHAQVWLNIMKPNILNTQQIN